MTPSSSSAPSSPFSAPAPAPQSWRAAPLRPGLITLLLLARPVRAGFPSLADDHLERSLSLDELLVRNAPATFLVRVRGDSMAPKRLFDGDLALVDRSLAPLEGDVVVVDVDGERSFKVWSARGGRVSLASAGEGGALVAREVAEGALVEVGGAGAGSLNPRRRAARG